MKHESPTSRRDDRSASNVSLYGSGRADAGPVLDSGGGISHAANHAKNHASAISADALRSPANRGSISGAGAQWSAGLRALGFDWRDALHLEYRRLR